jgi:hypothetical protein
MTTQDHLPHTGFDVIHETSVQSFPASDAPGWATGRSYRTAHRSGDIDRCVDPIRKEEASRVSNSKQEDSAPLFR